MKHITFIFALIFSLGISAKDRQKELPGVIYGTEPVVVKGTVKNAVAGDSVAISYYVVGGDATTIAVPVAADGTFTLSYKNYYTDRVNFTIAGHSSVAVFAPGETATVTVDRKLLGAPKAKKPAVVFNGTCGDFNTDMAQFGNQYDAGKVFESITGDNTKALKGLDVEGYKQKVLSMYDEAMAKLAKDKRICGAFRSYVEATYKYQLVMRILFYKAPLRIANDLEEAPEAPEGYFDCLKDYNPFPTTAFIYTMNSAAVPATTNTIAALTGQKFQPHASLDQLKSAITYLNVISQQQTLSPEQIAAVDTECPELRDLIIPANEKLIALREAAKNATGYTVKELSADLTGEDVFKQLIAPYKGKPLLVDFWATWCGPCKAAMKTILPVKEQLEGKANFIYITGPTSPRGAWEIQIADIHGDHYYVTDEQYSTLLSQFQSNGIPTYVTVDADGNVKNHYVGYPGNDVMLKDLSE